MDFNHPDPFSVTFDTTSTSGTLACVDIPTIVDAILEGDHNFSVSLSYSNQEDNVQLSIESVTAVIKDNNSEFRLYLAMQMHTYWIDS